MSLSIQQSQEYVGNDRWRWSVWLNGTPEELDSVDHVTYVLHPTFHDPVRHISDRVTNFRLDTFGWGTFTMHANIVHRDGHASEADLWLPVPAENSPSVQQPDRSRKTPVTEIGTAKSASDMNGERSF